jgi:chromosome segregation ATPase
MDSEEMEKSATVLENVFWDSTSGLVLLSQSESEVSPTTGAQMENIGFVEKNDSEKTEMIKFLVDSAKGINTSKMIKEVSPMTDTTNDVVEETTVEEAQVAPEADATAEAVAEEAVAADVEKSADADEDDVAGSDVAEESDDMSGTEDDEEEVAKSDSVAEEVSKSDEAIVSAVADIKNSLTSAFSDLAVTIKSLNEQVTALNKSLDNANSEIAAVKSEVANAKSEFNEFGKRVDAVEADTAFRKSGDLGEIVQEQPEQVEKSLWGGRFLKTADLLK